MESDEEMCVRLGNGAVEESHDRNSCWKSAKSLSLPVYFLGRKSRGDDGGTRKERGKNLQESICYT